jgi:hypothetical protein
LLENPEDPKQDGLHLDRPKILSQVWKSRKIRMPNRGSLVALVLVLALALSCAESAKKPLEDEVKLVSSAVDALTTEIEGIKAK